MVRYVYKFYFLKHNVLLFCHEILNFFAWAWTQHRVEGIFYLLVKKLEDIENYFGFVDISHRRYNYVEMSSRPCRDVEQTPYSQVNSPGYIWLRNIFTRGTIPWYNTDLKLSTYLESCASPWNNCKRYLSLCNFRADYNKHHPRNGNIWYCNCSLSLWRVVRGSKLMHLDSLIHGLFIT
jgi:hypothetical protein